MLGEPISSLSPLNFSPSFFLLLSLCYCAMESFGFQHSAKSNWVEEESEYPLCENNNNNNNNNHEEEEEVIVSELEESKLYKRQEDHNTSASSLFTYDSYFSEFMHDPFSNPLVHGEREVHAKWNSEETKDGEEIMPKLFFPGLHNPPPSVSSTPKEGSTDLPGETALTRGTAGSSGTSRENEQEEEGVAIGTGEREWRGGEEDLSGEEEQHLYASRNEESRMVASTSTDVVMERMEGWEAEAAEEGSKERRENQSLAELYGLETVSDEEEEGEEENGGGEDGHMVEVDSLDDEEEDGVRGIYSLRYNPSPSSSHPLPSTSHPVDDGLSVHRVRQLLRYEGSSSILSKEAVMAVTKAVSLMVQDLIRTAAAFAQRRCRQRVTSRDIAHIISLYDRFSFLAEVVPLPEKRIETGVARPLRSGNNHATTTSTSSSSGTNGGGILSMMMMTQSRGEATLPMDSWARGSKDDQGDVREVEDGVKEKEGERLGETCSSKNLLGGAFVVTVESEENKEKKVVQNAFPDKSSNRRGGAADGVDKGIAFSPPSFRHPSDFPKSNRMQQSTLRF